MRAPPAVLLLWLLPSATLAGSDLRLPGGERREKAGAVTVALGFGSVTFPAKEEAGPIARAGEKLACNRGTFSLSYDLRRGKHGVRAEKVSVRVTNVAEYFAGRHPKLEEHERGHQRINEAGAPQIERNLSSFANPGRDLKAAERALKERFRRELSALEALHREWDATSVILSTGEKP